MQGNCFEQFSGPERGEDTDKAKLAPALPCQEQRSWATHSKAEARGWRTGDRSLGAGMSRSRQAMLGLGFALQG
jgi:hypothetical protein